MLGIGDNDWDVATTIITSQVKVIGNRRDQYLESTFVANQRECADRVS
jgi:hypothetical protein